MQQILVTTTSALVLLLATSLQADELEPREKAFSERMSNVTLVGAFTVDGKTDGPPRSERYEIKSVTKLGGNLWTFLTRVKYGKIDTKVPITVPLEWAGDTPMVSLTDATLPGLGAGFSARVIFHDGRYAGTWQHGPVGGHMFGRIEKTKPTAEPEKSAE
ncbi:MAG: hypothetical protein ABGZ53_32805 [Fuerstiella sp.]|jgi:hypothetical protein